MEEARASPGSVLGAHGAAQPKACALGPRARRLSPAQKQVCGVQDEQ